MNTRGCPKPSNHFLQGDPVVVRDFGAGNIYRMASSNEAVLPLDTSLIWCIFVCSSFIWIARSKVKMCVRETSVLGGKIQGETVIIMSQSAHQDTDLSQEYIWEWARFFNGCMLLDGKSRSANDWTRFAESSWNMMPQTTVKLESGQKHCEIARIRLENIQFVFLAFVLNGWYTCQLVCGYWGTADDLWARMCEWDELQLN